MVEGAIGLIGSWTGQISEALEQRTFRNSALEDMVTKSGIHNRDQLYQLLLVTIREELFQIRFA